MSFLLYPDWRFIFWWIVATFCKGERKNGTFETKTFVKSVDNLRAEIIMDHKRLLSSCVEVLDSFNPRIHGVLEHLNTCLATKLVRKLSLLTQKSVWGLIFNFSCGVNSSRQGLVLFRLWSSNLISILILVCSGSCWRWWVLYYRSFLWMCAVC